MHSVIAERIVDNILGSQARRAVPAPSNGPAPTLPSAGRARTEPTETGGEVRRDGWAEGGDRAVRCRSAQRMDQLPEAALRDPVRLGDELFGRLAA